MIYLLMHYINLLQVSQSKIEEEVDSLKSMLAKAQQRSDETKKVLQTVEDDCRTWLPRLKEMLNSSYETRLSQVNQSWEGLLNSLKEELEGSQTTAQENNKKYQQALGERDSFNTQLTGTLTIASFLLKQQFLFHNRVKVPARGFEK